MINKEIYRVLIEKFGKKSNFEGFKAILIDYLIIGITVFLSEEWVMHMTGVLFFSCYFLICIILASRYRGFEILVHEASHNNVFATNAYNRNFQFLFAYPVFLHVRTYAKIHLEHHQLIGDFEKDPDILIYKKWGLDKLPENKLWVLYLRPLSLFFTWDHLRTTFLNFWLIKEDRLTKIIYWSIVLLVITLFDGWYYVGVYYLIPFYILLPVLRFYARANEHTGVDFSIESRSARNNLGFFHRYILHPHGDGYHQVHHLVASVPFFNLPKAHHFLLTNNFKFLDSNSPITSLAMMEKGCKDTESSWS